VNATFSLDCDLFLHILNATNQRKCRHGNRFKKQQITTNRLKSAIELIGELEKVKEEGESTAGFVVASIKGEIKRRQRKQATEADKEWIPPNVWQFLARGPTSAIGGFMF
jgi:hypothetical protein